MYDEPTPPPIGGPVVPPPLPPPVHAQIARPAQSIRKPPEHAIIWGAIGAIVMCAGGGLFGLASSQFFPCWGGFLAGIAEPFSRVRLQLMPGHVVVFGAAGLLMGAFIGWGLHLLIRAVAE